MPGEAIRAGQTVRLTYTDPTSGNDLAALQDWSWNDIASFDIEGSVRRWPEETVKRCCQHLAPLG